MDAQDVGLAGLVGLVLGLVVLIGARDLLHRRATGASGIKGMSGSRGSVEWWGGVGFVVAIGIILLGFGYVAAGLWHIRTVPSWLVWTGASLGLIGAAGVWWTQAVMGRSWRFGIDENERPQLVTHGPFAWVRNPIYSFMILGLFGGVLMIANALTIAGWALLIAAVELQVRGAEEPYLSATNPDYLEYAGRVGRFVPGVGKLGP